MTCTKCQRLGQANRALSRDYAKLEGENERLRKRLAEMQGDRHYRPLPPTSTVGHLPRHADTPEGSGRSDRAAKPEVMPAWGPKALDRPSPAPPPVPRPGPKPRKAQKVLDLLRQNPEHTGATIAQALGVSAPTAYKHLTRLLERGLIEATPHPHHNRRKIYTVIDQEHTHAA